MKISSSLKKDIYILLTLQFVFWVCRIVYLLNTDHSFHGDATSKLNISFQQFDYFYHWPVHFWLPLPFDIIHLAGMLTSEWVTTTRIVPSLLLSFSICFLFFYLKAQFSKFVSITSTLVLSLTAPLIIISTSYLAEAYSISFMLISLYFYQDSKNELHHSFFFGLFVSAGLLTRYEMFIFGFVFIMARVYRLKWNFMHLISIGISVLPITFYIFYMNYHFSGNFLHGFFAHTKLMEILNLNFPSQLQDLIIFKYGLPLGFISLIIGCFELIKRLRSRLKDQKEIGLEIFIILYGFILLNNILTNNLVIDFRFTIMIGIFFGIYTLSFLDNFKNKRFIFSIVSLILLLEFGFNTIFFKNNIHFKFDTGLKDTAHYVKEHLGLDNSLYVDRSQEHGVRMWHTEAWFPIANRKTNNYHPDNSVKCIVDNSPVEIDSEDILLKKHLECLEKYSPEILVTFKDGYLDRLIKRKDPSFNKYTLNELYSSNGYKVIRMIKNEEN